MNKLFRVKNKGGSKIYISAETEEEAKDIALASGHVRKIENCTVYEGEGFLSYYELFKQRGTDMTEVDEKKGTGCVEIDDSIGLRRWLIHEFDIKE